MAGKVKQRRARKVYTSELAESFANAVNLAAKQVSKEKPDSPSATLDKKECCKACSAKKVALPTSLLHKQKRSTQSAPKEKGSVWITLCGGELVSAIAANQVTGLEAVIN